MRKADVVVVVLAVAVVLVTLTGVAASDRWTGERTFGFAAGEEPAPPQGPAPAGPAPARFEWPAPDNATAIALNVTITFTGQALQGGQATIRIGGTAPDGSNLPASIMTLAIPQGATSSSVDLPYAAAWLEMPDDVRDTRTPPPAHWAAPLVITVSVDAPGDAPIATYAFTAQAVGVFVVYALQ